MKDEDITIKDWLDRIRNANNEINDLNNGLNHTTAGALHRHIEKIEISIRNIEHLLGYTYYKIKSDS